MKLKVIYDKTEIGINGNIFRLFPHLLNLKKDELIYFDIKNIFLCNSGNAWDVFFYQPFYNYEKEIKEKLKKKDFEKLKWNSLPLFEITYNNKDAVYDRDKIQKYRKVFQRFIKFRDEINLRAENFLKKNKIKNALSIHLRGGDRFSTSSHAPNQRSFLDINNISKIIDKFLNKYSCDQIFLATDEQLLFENLNRKFKGIVSKNDTHLAPKSNNRSIHKVAVFQSDKIKFKLGSDVLTDAIIMSKCKYSLFMHSQVSYLSLMLREDFNFFL